MVGRGTGEVGETRGVGPGVSRAEAALSGVRQKLSLEACHTLSSPQGPAEVGTSIPGWVLEEAAVFADPQAEPPIPTPSPRNP